MSRSLKLLFIVFCWVQTTGVSAQDTDDINILNSLVSTVCNLENTPRQNISSNDSENLLGVLTYLGNVYADHGYHESGNWSGTIAGTRRIRRGPGVYEPYVGKLPDYEISDFHLPTDGQLTSIYGYRPRFKRFHQGIDLSLHKGDTVKCSLPGTVVKTGYDLGGYGCYVKVAHSGGVETLYGHLHIILVKAGQKLSAGEALGLGGSTGNATGPHLHFETRYRGVAIDPISWFNLKGKIQ